MLPEGWSVCQDCGRAYEVAAGCDRCRPAPDPLRLAADRLLAAAMDYWREFQRTNRPGGAVVWVQDEDGRLVILTRGEYRERLMLNVDELGTPVLAFEPDA